MLHFSFNPFPSIVTDRLSFRKLSVDDANDFYNLRTHPKVIHYLDREAEKSVKEVFPIIESVENSIKNNTGILWVICLKGSRKLIGTIGYWKTEAAHHRAEIGYLLMPDYWGQGFMDEALKAIITYGWDTMMLHSIEARINPQNAASKNLLLKNGFEKEGYFKESYHYAGRFLDTEILSLVNKHLDNPNEK